MLNTEAESVEDITAASRKHITMDSDNPIRSILEKKIDECSREYDRKEDAQGRKHDTSSITDGFPCIRFKTAREQDDAQCYYTEELREIIIVEYKSESVASEQHSDQQEYEEEGTPYLFPVLETTIAVNTRN